MKQILIICLALPVLAGSARAQQLQIRQSMETAELREEPAQLLGTFPEGKPASWVLDAGLAWKLRTRTNPAGLITGTSKLIAEYHLKTETDKEQNNVQVGYGGIRRLTSRPANRVNMFLEGDIKYVYDGRAINHSLAADGLVTLYRSATPGSNYLHWNAPNFFGHFSSFLSPHVGLQAQEVFKAPDDQQSTQGFIIRPVADVQAVFRYNKTSAGSTPNPDADRKLELSLRYVARYDAVNTTGNREHYTDLFTAALRYYLLNSPLAKASVGISFNTGSDPVKGLADQSYWLFSLNISK